MSINVQSLINQLGYGVHGLNTVLALEAAGVETALTFIGEPEAPPEHHEALRRMAARSEFFDPAAPSLRIYHQFDFAQSVGRGKRCGYTFFELDRLTRRERHHLGSLDLLFVSSAWAKGVAESCVPGLEVVVAPPGIDRKIFFPRAESPPGADDITVFFHCGKWEYRKGVDVLLEAFNKAFEPDDRVKLVMNCHNPCRSARIRSAEDSRRYNEGWANSFLSSKMGRAGKIIIIPDRLPTQTDVADLMATADCGVFPSRAEGWGFESAEMLAMGKHVILTDYSAHTEYATRDSSLLITPESTEEAFDGHWFSPDDPGWGGDAGRWACLRDGEVDQLVSHLRFVHGQKRSGELLFNQEGYDDMKQFTWVNTAGAIIESAFA